MGYKKPCQTVKKILMWLGVAGKYSETRTGMSSGAFTKLGCWSSHVVVLRMCSGENLLVTEAGAGQVGEGQRT